MDFETPLRILFYGLGAAGVLWLAQFISPRQVAIREKRRLVAETQNVLNRLLVMTGLTKQATDYNNRLTGLRDYTEQMAQDVNWAVAQLRNLRTHIENELNASS